MRFSKTLQNIFGILLFLIYFQQLTRFWQLLSFLVHGHCFGRLYFRSSSFSQTTRARGKISERIMEWTLLFFGCRMPKSYSRIARWPSPRQISPQSVHCTGGGLAPKKVDVFADNALSCKVCDKRLCHQGFEFRIVLMSMDRGLYFVHPLSFYPQKRSERNVSV